MTSRTRAHIALLTLLIILFASVPRGLACGPFSLDTIFVFTVHPEYPLIKFAQGDLGIIQPGFARSYLFVAYRHLSGNGFNATEEKSLAELWKERLDFLGGPDDQDWIQQWHTARGKVPGLEAAPAIDVYRHQEKPNEYETFLNCQKDAFNNAVTTLELRIKKYGADSVPVKEWIAAQDQVFANCSEGQHIPDALTESDALRRADRNYQIAAAYFYSEQFGQARRMFEAIGNEADSPWRETVPYLIARTFVREASLGPAETRQEKLTEAERRLNDILADQKLSSLHAAARRLLSVVTLRRHPEQRLHELAGLLLQKDREQTLKQDLWDYTALLDQLIGDEDKPTRPQAAIADDLGDWILTFQTNSPEMIDHAVSKWQETHSTPWLIAAISKIDAKRPEAGALIAEANRIPADSPAYPTALFHVLRMEIGEGKVDQARQRLDRALLQNRSILNVSTLNQLLNLRMILSTSLDEFLTYAQRVPAAFSWNDDGREIPVDPKEEEESTRALEGKPLFDLDATQILNQGLPLSLLKEAAANKTLPAHLRRDLVQATWLRAVLLGDFRAAEALSPDFKALVPDAAPLVDVFLRAPQPEAKRFSALYTWLKFPGLEPVVDTGIGRQTPLAQQDIYRDNWWCGAALSPDPDAATNQEKKEGPLLPFEPARFPVFLIAAERAAAAREHAVLAGLGAAPNYLSRQVIDWGTKNADDPRVPEALHLAVKATRYGCTDKETGRWSKAAFELLHKRYPASVWAKRTPYWFKD